MTTPRELALAACEAADDKKALRPVLIEVEAVSSIADFFVICSGSTPIQVRAIAEQKMPDLNANDLDAAEKIIAGTARSMGVTVTD